MRDAERLGEALKAIGYVDVKVGPRYVAAGSLAFSRRSENEGFSTATADDDRLKAVQRKYAELAMRAFAVRRGYTIDRTGDNAFTLINRRGG